MKIWQKIYFEKDGVRIKKYKFCGITVLREEKASITKTLNILGLKFSKKIHSKKSLSDYQLFKSSEYFDKKWYLQQYPDVAGAHIDPLEHYIKIGWREGYKPCKKFDTQFYLQKYPDVVRDDINPLRHYILYGKKEGRLINPDDRPSYMRKVWRKLFKHRKSRPFVEQHQAQIVATSKFFDPEWYEHTYKNSITAGSNLAANYLRNYTRDPGPEFSSKEYLLINPDVAASKMNPLLHYEQWGWKEKRAISLADIKPFVFPQGTADIKRKNYARQNTKHKIVSVFASFSGDGKIADYVVYLLKHLHKISDYIIFVADNPLYKRELNKIKPYCNVCLCERHEEYDFGSYKRGYQYLIDNNILQKNDNLLFFNDANYGPIYPLENVIKDFKQKNCDFYGLSVSRAPKRHLQSFFYIFKPRVYKSTAFKTFLQGVKKELSSANVVYKYEMNFTEVLHDAGFSYDSYVDDKRLLPAQKNIIPTKWGLTLMRDFNYPLVKIKALQGSSMENPEEILEYIRQENKELYDIIEPHISEKLAKLKRRKANKVSPYTLHEKYDATLATLKQKIAHGQKIRVIFLVNISSMFSAENVMNLLQKDNLFAVELYVIPDIRFGDEKMSEMINATYNELKKKYDFAKMAVEFDEQGQICKWNNVVEGADIVFYPSPYDLSYSLYNPYYAAQNGILSVQLDYGFYRSKYDRFIYQLDNYNNFWRTYIETELNYDEYAEYGRCNASNAVVTGYAKMDKLVQYKQKRYGKNRRKTIMIAPHHSVDGGTNSSLSLSNFVRYADLFLELPQRYPNIDFIFRPHPMLFTILSWDRHWGKEKVQEYIAKMKLHPNVIYSDGGDYLEQFVQSDGIIQDCGSYLVEYLYTKKPACYMLKTPEDIDAKFAELGKRCLEQYYIAYNEQDIIDYIDNVIIGGDDPKKLSRKKFAEEVVMLNYPHASEKIVAEIKKELMEK